MKKLIVFLLILSLVFTFTACNRETYNTPAGNNRTDSLTQTRTPDTTENPPVSSTAQGVTLTLNKSVYAPNENITVTITGVTDEMINAQAFASIYKAGAEHENYQEYHYPQSFSDTLNFTAPNNVGDFEMRFYKQDYIYTDETFVLSVAFKVYGNITVPSTPAIPDAPIAEPPLEEPIEYTPDDSSDFFDGGGGSGCYWCYASPCICHMFDGLPECSACYQWPCECFY